MNIKNIVVAALIASAGLSAVSVSAFAEDQVPQGKTRAEVKAELAQYRAEQAAGQHVDTEN